MSEPWLTKRELARTLKVSPRTVERQRFPAWRVGGQNRYRLSEVERERFQRDVAATTDNVIQFPRRRDTA